MNPNCWDFSGASTTRSLSDIVQLYCYVLQNEASKPLIWTRSWRWWFPCRRARPPTWRACHLLWFPCQRRNQPAEAERVAWIYLERKRQWPLPNQRSFSGPGHAAKICLPGSSHGFHWFAAEGLAARWRAHLQADVHWQESQSPGTGSGFQEVFGEWSWLCIENRWESSEWISRDNWLWVKSLVPSEHQNSW